MSWSNVFICYSHRSKIIHLLFCNSVTCFMLWEMMHQVFNVITAVLCSFSHQLVKCCLECSSFDSSDNCHYNCNPYWQMFLEWLFYPCFERLVKNVVAYHPHFSNCTLCFVEAVRISWNLFFSQKMSISCIFSLNIDFRFISYVLSTSAVL